MHRMTIIATVLTLAAGCALDMDGEIESPDDLEEYADETEPGDDDLEQIEYAEPTGSGGNLLSNPGFEKIGLVERGATYIFLDGWSGYFGTDSKIDLVSAPHTGTKSMRITDSAIGGATSLVRTVHMSAGPSFELSAWTRNKGGGTCSQHLVVYYWGRTGNLGRGPIVGTSAAAWTRLVSRFTPPVGTTAITINAGDPRSWGDCGVYDWDDFSLRTL